MASRASYKLITRITIRQPLLKLQARSYASSSPAYDRPPYPSVEVLLHTHNLSAKDIKATGPQGRILKGDVLAHIGSINKETPEKLEKRFEKLAHLDLSNITPAPAPSKEEKATKAPAVAAVEEVIEEVQELSLGIDLKPMLKLQQRLKEALGHTPDLPELIARAVDLANRDLPASIRPSTTDELFDEIIAGPRLGLRLQDGTFEPAINSSAPIALISQPVDIFDELTSPTPVVQHRVTSFGASAKQGAINDFSVLTSSQERQRATVFLQRMKSVLEVEPGRLVL